MIEDVSPSEDTRIRQYIRENPSSGVPAVLGRFVLSPDKADEVRRLLRKHDPRGDELKTPRCADCGAVLVSTLVKDNAHCPDCDELQVVDDE